MTVPPQVLKNKGVPVHFYVVEPTVREKTKPRMKDGKIVIEDGKPVMDIEQFVVWRPKTVEKDGEVTEVTIREWVKFDANALATVEHYFGSMVGFQKASEERPNETIRLAVVAMLGGDLDDETEVEMYGARLIPTDMTIYQTAVMACLSMANGVDPTQAARMVEEGRLAVKEEVEKANEEVKKMLDEAEAEREAEAAAEAEPKPELKELPELVPSRDTPGSDGSDSGSESAEPTTSSGD